jgi:hypothetical protein
MQIRKIALLVFVFAAVLGVLAIVVLQSMPVQLWLDRIEVDRVDARIAEARKVSDAAAVEALREMLQSQSFLRERAISRLHKLQFSPEALVAAAPELVSILEEDSGFVSMASEELQRIGPLVPDSLVPRLLELTKHGEPDWRKMHAVFVLKAKWNGKTIGDPAVAAAVRDVEQSEWFRRLIVMPKEGADVEQEAPDFDPRLILAWPGSPTESRRRLAEGTPEETTFYTGMLTLTGPVTTFSATVHEFTEQSLQGTDSQQMLKDNALGSDAGPNHTMTEIQRQGHPGFEFTGRSGAAYVRRIVVLSGRRLYRLEVLSTGQDRFQADDVIKFFDSFMIKE